MDVIALIEANWGVIMAAVMIIPLTFAAWSRWNLRTLMFFCVVAVGILADGFTARSIFIVVMLLPLVYITWRKEFIISLSYLMLMIALIAGV